MRTRIYSVEEYIAAFPQETQKVLDKIRTIILEIAPESVESMAYGIPAYKLHGKPLVYFAGYANHIGFYAIPSGHIKFATELSQYKKGKGSVQFPLNKPIPYDLIARMVEFRKQENMMHPS